MKKFEFSKLLLVFETVIVGVLSMATLFFCYLSIITGYNGALPFLTTMTTAAWGAYAVSAGFYYNKAKSENQIKITAAVEAPKPVKRDL